jgi:hypothetical protein
MKGQIFTFEASIAILMILSVIIFLFQNPSTSLEYERINYKMKAYNGLEILEKTGELRRYAADNNATAINDSLSPYIPSFLSYDVVIFNDTTNTTPKPSLSRINESISVSYFLAGDLNDYKPRDVRVYVWGYD